MQLKTILNRVQKFKSFTYGEVHWDQMQNGETALLVEVLPRRNSRPPPRSGSLPPRSERLPPVVVLLFAGMPACRLGGKHSRQSAFECRSSAHHRRLSADGCRQGSSCPLSEAGHQLIGASGSLAGIDDLFSGMNQPFPGVNDSLPGVNDSLDGMRRHSA